MNRWFDNLPVISKYVPGKVVLSFLMLMLAVILFVFNKTIDRAVCIYAMVLSFCGDYTLNHYPKKIDNSKTNFILGGISFILAHYFYCITYGLKMYQHGFPFFNAGSVFAIIILAGITIYFLFKAKNEKKDKLFAFGMLYLWLTGINYMTVFSYAYSIKSIESLALIGGLSFLASDVIIGCERFLGLKSKKARELVWWLYPIGQILLICMA